MQSDDPVPAITEAEAQGEIAEIYRDIREVLGAPVVNLVWRHLATFDGVLPWCWLALKPIYVSGRTSIAAADLRETATLPAVRPWPRPLLEAVGVGAEDQAGIGRVLSAYDRTNAMNLIALTALRLRIKQGNGDVAASPAGFVQPGPDGGVSGELPVLLPLSDMPPPLADLVCRLNAIGAGPDDTILASMYRHLAHWPAFLGLAWTLLSTLEQEGRLAAASGVAREAAERKAHELVPALRPPEAPLPHADQAVAALRAFTDGPIGRMFTLCRLLNTAFSRESGV